MGLVTTFSSYTSNIKKTARRFERTCFHNRDCISVVAHE